jgi:hypothetical protein
VTQSSNHIPAKDDYSRPLWGAEPVTKIQHSQLLHITFQILHRPQKCNHLSSPYPHRINSIFAVLTYLQRRGKNWHDNPERLQRAQAAEKPESPSRAQLPHYPFQLPIAPVQLLKYLTVPDHQTPHCILRFNTACSRPIPKIQYNFKGSQISFSDSSY